MPKGRYKAVAAVATPLRARRSLSGGVWTLPQPGNDQIGVYSAVPGYNAALASPTPTGTPNSAVSVVVYRVNSDSTSSAYNKMERMGKGLVWNGVSTTDIPVVFIPI